MAKGISRSFGPGGAADGAENKLAQSLCKILPEHQVELCHAFATVSEQRLLWPSAFVILFDSPEVNDKMLSRAPQPRDGMNSGRTANRGGIVRRGLLPVAAALVMSGLSCISGREDINFGIVAPGVLMRSAQPEPNDLAEMQRTHGLKTIVNLRSQSTVAKELECKDEKAFAEAHGVKFVNLPVGTPLSREHIREFLRIMDDSANHPVLVHCSQGQIRAGMMCAVYGMERLGWTNERALAEQIPFKFEQSKHNKDAARQFILGYRRESPPPPKPVAKP
ncbi:MAG: sulfur transferase domain-containing protein [Planctomycetota bacterium]